MILSKLGFRDYFHNYLVLEADTLTDSLKDKIAVAEEDCYMLCSSYISRTGALLFNVLSIGSTWTNCRKGLEQEEMLSIFDPYILRNLRTKKIIPEEAMKQKNIPWIRKQEEDAGERLAETRENEMLDGVRNDFYPDIVRTGILTEAGIREYDMQVDGFNGPFVEGRLLEQTKIRGFHQGQLLRALPYKAGKGFRLLCVFAGDPLSDEDEEAMERLSREGMASGFGFAGRFFRN